MHVSIKSSLIKEKNIENLKNSRNNSTFERIRVTGDKNSDIGIKCVFATRVGCSIHVMDDKNLDREIKCVYNKSWLLSIDTIFTSISKSNPQLKG